MDKQKITPNSANSPVSSAIMPKSRTKRFQSIKTIRNFTAKTKADFAINPKSYFWCIYTTTLEPILARIFEMDERSAPPPAAAKRRPASQKNFLYNF
ncbi:MAG: hypothetical protein HYY51_01790 [Candidatus Magasanikbacteria bacterium]|nr:hypothetical protein [Candidatus Magasanikbacteria bacterium]